MVVFLFFMSTLKISVIQKLGLSEMNANIDNDTIELPHMVMHSPLGKPLPLTLFKGKEGIESEGVEVYETTMTFKELADHFVVEDNSDKLEEKHKRQRDVDKGRVNNLKNYFETQQATVFPNITIFVSSLLDKQEHKIGNKKLVSTSLPPEADRFICDGQGRTTFIKWLLNEAQKDEYADHTISSKIIVTNTQDLQDDNSVRIIKQVFADYHVMLKKPNGSISKHFDNSKPFSRLINRLLEVEVENQAIQQYIGLHGNCNNGQIWTFAQFTGMVSRFLGTDAKSANSALEDEESFENTYEMCERFLQRVFTLLPVQLVGGENHKNVHENAVFTKAIFAYALGHVGRSLWDESIVDDKAIDWFKLKSLDSVDITDRTARVWVDKGVYIKDGKKIRVAKGGEKRIAEMFCRMHKIYLCEAITAS